MLEYLFNKVASLHRTPRLAASREGCIKCILSEQDILTPDKQSEKLRGKQTNIQ